MSPLNRIPLSEVKARTYKARDSWWTVLLVDPVAAPLVRLTAPYRWLTPNRISIAAMLVGFGSAACFATAQPRWLAVGALLFHLAFVLDCMDGKIARLNGSGSHFGAWLDYMLDRVRVVTCAAALFGAQYAQTRNAWHLVVGAVVVFLDAVHHVNSLEINKVKAGMRRQLAAVQERRAAAEAAHAMLHRPDAPGPGRSAPVGAPTPVVAGQPGPVDDLAPAPVTDPRPDFRARFKPYVLLREGLRASRIRLNVVSTVELHMAVFIVAPLTGWIIGVSAGISALLAVFELAISYNLYLTSAAFTRRLAAATARADAAEADLRAAQPAPGADRVSAQLTAVS